MTTACESQVRFYLHNFFELEKDIRQLKEMLDVYIGLDGIKAKFVTIITQTGDGESVVERTVIKREHISDLIRELEYKMMVHRAIYSVYAYLKEPDRTIIEMRYFTTPKVNDVRRSKHSWKEISAETGHSIGRCWAVDTKIVRRIQDRMRFAGTEVE